jgi:hypothetical protein
MVRVTREDERYQCVLFNRFDSTTPEKPAGGIRIETEERTVFDSSRKRSPCLVAEGDDGRSASGERSPSLVLCSSLLHSLALTAL